MIRSVCNPDSTFDTEHPKDTPLTMIRSVCHPDSIFPGEFVPSASLGKPAAPSAAQLFVCIRVHSWPNVFAVAGYFR